MTKTPRQPDATPEARFAAAAKRPEADPEEHAGATVFGTPEAIERFRQITLLHGLRLEALGVRVHHHVSCLAVARRDYGIKARTAADAVLKLKAILEAHGIIESHS